jgi:membrane peptidoglycan carboxypeptidase
LLSQNQSSSNQTWNAVINQIRDEDFQHKAARQQALSELLQSWEEEGDEQEQNETLQFIQQALNEDRLSNRPLFP